MKLLLDANVVVWMLSDTQRLSPTVKKIIAGNRTFVSTASLLEITS